MPTTFEAVGAISGAIGFTTGRTKSVARELTDAGSIASGGPGRAPELDIANVVAIVIGSAIDGPLRSVPDAVAAYQALTPAGVPLDQLPLALRTTAGLELEAIANAALNGNSADLELHSIEIVSTWREVAIHYSGRTERFIPTGECPDFWQSAGHRRAVTIAGSAFISAIKRTWSR